MLVRAGFAFMGDDTLFLTAPNSGKLRVLAFPDEADVTEQTASFFPELQKLSTSSHPPGKK